MLSAAFGALCPGGCTHGKTYSHREDETGSTCRVCGGFGSVPDDELAAWKQDPAYMQGRLHGTYTGFYEAAFLTHIKGNVALGILPLITIGEFIAQRRADQGVPPINARFIHSDISAVEMRLRCPAECFDGQSANRHYEDTTSFPCKMCEPYGGTGTIPAATLARWMSDTQYREYFNGLRYRPGERISHDAWVRGRGRAPAAPGPSLPPAAPGTSLPPAAPGPSLPPAAPGPSLPPAASLRPRPSTMSALVAWARGLGVVTGSTSATSVSLPPAPSARPDNRGAPIESARKKTKGAQPEETLVSEPANPKLCVICFDREKNTAFIPCGHFGLCDACALGLRRCPVCRTKGKSNRIYDVSFGQVGFIPKSRTMRATRLMLPPSTVS
jgi:hypothetical protein